MLVEVEKDEVENEEAEKVENDEVENSAQAEPTDTTKQSNQDSPDDSLEQGAGQILNNSAENAKTNVTDATDDTHMQDSLTEQEQARLDSLKAMLDASNARYKQATRNRRPKFAAGLKIKVVGGEFSGETGVVLDADYIANRALISIPSKETPRWIGFESLGHFD